MAQIQLVEKSELVGRLMLLAEMLNQIIIQSNQQSRRLRHKRFSLLVITTVNGQLDTTVTCLNRVAPAHLLLLLTVDVMSVKMFAFRSLSDPLWGPPRLF
jgi:hypothetical protein